MESAQVGWLEYATESSAPSMPAPLARSSPCDELFFGESHVRFGTHFERLTWPGSAGEMRHLL